MQFSGRRSGLQLPLVTEQRCPAASSSCSRRRLEPYSTVLRAGFQEASLWFLQVSASHWGRPSPVFTAPSPLWDVVISHLSEGLWEPQCGCGGSLSSPPLWVWHTPPSCCRPALMGLLQRCLAPEGGKQKEKLSVWQLFTGEPIEKVLCRCEMCL